MPTDCYQYSFEASIFYTALSRNHQIRRSAKTLKYIEMKHRKKLCEVQECGNNYEAYSVLIVPSICHGISII